MTAEATGHIDKRLCEDWSPEQISGTMDEDLSIRVSHESIYQYIWADKKAGGDLYKHLRIAGTKKRRKTRGNQDWRGRIPDRVDIDQRPACVDKKERVGDWEADLISGARHKGFLVTLVERKHKYTVIGHVNHKTAQNVQDKSIFRRCMVLFLSFPTFVSSSLSSRNKGDSIIFHAGNARWIHVNCDSFSVDNDPGE